MPGRSISFYTFIHIERANFESVLKLVKSKLDFTSKMLMRMFSFKLFFEFLLVLILKQQGMSTYVKLTTNKFWT